MIWILVGVESMLLLILLCMCSVLKGELAIKQLELDRKTAEYDKLLAEQPKRDSKGRFKKK